MVSATAGDNSVMCGIFLLVAMVCGSTRATNGEERLARNKIKNPVSDTIYHMANISDGNMSNNY